MSARASLVVANAYSYRWTSPVQGGNLLKVVGVLLPLSDLYTDRNMVVKKYATSEAKMIVIAYRPHSSDAAGTLWRIVQLYTVALPLQRLHAKTT